LEENIAMAVRMYSGSLVSRLATASLLIVVLPCLGGLALAQPRLVIEKPFGYQVGEHVSAETTVLDKEMKPVGLVSLIRPETKLVVLAIIGGAVREVPTQRPLRGTLWCEDSFDDLAVQRALVHAFAKEPVQFIAVALPPVFSPARYGYTEGIFLGHPDDSPAFLENTKAFIAATEKEIKTGLLPFSSVYYDPRLRLLLNPKSGDAPAASAPVPEWQGKFKWHLDPRRYGVPTLWLLDSKGQVLQEPFVGNDYDSDPPQINYSYADVKAAIENQLAEIG
jgi:hypothetical protein